MELDKEYSPKKIEEEAENNLTSVSQLQDNAFSKFSGKTVIINL
jgi:hypothetical protein